MQPTNFCFTKQPTPFSVNDDDDDGRINFNVAYSLTAQSRRYVYMLCSELVNCESHRVSLDDAAAMKFKSTANCQTCRKLAATRLMTAVLGTILGALTTDAATPNGNDLLQLVNVTEFDVLNNNNNTSSSSSNNNSTSGDTDDGGRLLDEMQLIKVIVLVVVIAILLLSTCTFVFRTFSFVEARKDEHFEQ